MRFRLPCIQCFRERKPLNETFLVTFNEDSRYETRCALGHEAKLFIHDPKYQILFEIGAQAILDGYYREAVSSFTASLERFYEYSSRVFLERIAKQELFENCWKLVSRQSERQVGGFIFLWALNFGESPKLLSTSQVSFRNDVTHNGKIPTRDETVVYGNAVLAVLQPMANLLGGKFAKEVEIIDKRNCQSLNDNSFVVIAMANTINVSSAKGINSPSLEDNLIRISKQRDLIM